MKHNADRARIWRKAHPEAHRAYAAQSRINNAKYIKRKRDERRKKLHEIKGVPCMDCGGRFPPVCMDFDHRNPEEKTFELSNVMTRQWKHMEAEIAKCDIVCANCHRIRTRDRKVVSINGRNRD